MIQDIGEHTFDNQYHPCPPDRESYALYYEDHAALVRKYPDRIEFPKFRDIERLNEDIYEDAVYLFSIDGERYYLVEEINRERQSHFTMENTEIFRYAEPQYLAFAGITGYQLHNWYQSRRFCGKCGRRMKKDSKERMLYCESCHNMEFPKICPAVIIGVTDGDKILMSKYAGRTYKKYALLAGFTEIGETLEETVQREVMEEVGLKVKNIRYYNPYYHATLFPALPRVNGNYTYDKPHHGRFGIRQTDADNSDLESDYFVTHFSLETDHPLNGDVYIDGELTNHLYNENSRMTWNPATNRYEKALLLKQGSYNYNYLFIPHNKSKATPAFTEGNYYETVNEYLVKVYQRPIGARYDRLIGVAVSYSGV